MSKKSHPYQAQFPQKFLFILLTGVWASCHVLGSWVLGMHPAVVASPRFTATGQWTLR